MTFTPMLGTALLAKAVNRHVSAFALQESAGHKGYSARGLAKNVLVPRCVVNSIGIRTTGAEPLNNSPFFREKEVSRALGVSDRNRGDLEYLCALLAKADFLEGDDALRALAAFLRAREELTRKAPHVEVMIGDLSVRDVIERAAVFTLENAEGGRRGQAFVAACLDLAFDDVRSGLVNDPSVRVPGDALILEGGEPMLSAEAKQKPVSEAEIRQFAARLAAARVAQGMYCAFHRNQPSLDAGRIANDVLKEHGVVMMIYSDPSDLLRTAILWCRLPIIDAMKAFSVSFARRLVDFGCSEETPSAWVDRLAAEGDSPF